MKFINIILPFVALCTTTVIAGDAPPINWSKLASLDTVAPRNTPTTLQFKSLPVTNIVKVIFKAELSTVEGITSNLATVRKAPNAMLVKSLVRRSRAGDSRSHRRRRSGRKPDPRKELSKLRKLNKEALDTINSIREVNGKPPVKTSYELAQRAQDFANQCKFKSSKAAERGQVTELVMATAGDNGKATIKTALELWEQEAEDYKFKKFNASETSHITAMVWKASSEIGCAVSKECHDVNKGTALFVPNYPDTQLFVCYMLPPGNIGGKKTYHANVGTRLVTRESKKQAKKGHRRGHRGHKK